MVMHRMGLFRVGIALESLQMGAKIAIAKALVDTGSGYTWVSRAALESLGVALRRTRWDALGEMEAHDALEVGQVFSIDPQLCVPEENLNTTCQHIIVSTADRCENC